MQNALRRRAVAALNPTPDTPRLTLLAMRAIRAAEETSESRTPETARGIAQRIAADAGPSECLRIAVENQRVAAMRKFQPTPDVAASVLDVAERVVVEVLTPIVDSTWR